MGFTQWPSNASSGVPTYANYASLPASANDGDLGLTLDTDSLYAYNLALNKWLLIGTAQQTVTQVGTLDGGTLNAQSAYIGSNTIYFQTATITWPGVVSSGNQTFAGVKTFSVGPVFAQAPTFQSLTSPSTVVTLGSGSIASSVAYSTAPTGSAIIQRDVNGAATAVNFVSSLATVQSSGSAVQALNAGSARIQKVIGSNTARFTLPIATNMYTGQTYEFNNNSTGLVSIFLQDNVTGLCSMTSGSYLYVYNTDNSTANGTWDVHWLLPPNSAYGTSGLVIDGTIKANNLSGSNTSDLSITTVGTTPAAAGASLSGQVLTLQPADGTNPGVISTTTQTIQGSKSFNNPVLLPDGTVAAPGVAFTSETTTGMFKQGSGDIFLSVAGDRCLEMRNIAAGFVNLGINSSASSNAANPVVMNRTSNQAVYYQFGNLSNGAASGCVFQIYAGPSANYTTIENWAYANTAYIGGGSLMGGGVNQLQTVFVNEYTGSNSFQGFCIGGRTLASERMRLNFQGLQLNGGMFMRLIGSSTGGNALTMFANSSGTGYSMTWPGSQGAANTAPINDGSGNLTWTATLTNPMTTSGDIIVSSGTSTPARLAVGQSLQVLQVQNSKPAWLAAGWSNFRSITADTAVTASTDCIISISSASLFVTLPSSVGLQGKLFRFIHNGISLSQNYTLSTVGSQTISPVAPTGNATSVTMFTTGEIFDLVSDNANWVVTEHKAQTSWTSYTPTFFNLGSTTSVSFKWRRDGSEILIEGNGVTGVVVGATASCSLPGINLTIDSASLTITNNTTSGSTGSVIGRYYQEGSASNYGSLITAYGQNNTVFYFGGAGGQTTKIAPVNASIALQNNTQPFALTGIRIPILGWQP